MIISLNNLETSMPSVMQAITFCTACKYFRGSLWTSGRRRRVLWKRYHDHTPLARAIHHYRSSPTSLLLLSAIVRHENGERSRYQLLLYTDITPPSHSLAHAHVVVRVVEDKCRANAGSIAPCCNPSSPTAGELC